MEAEVHPRLQNYREASLASMRLCLKSKTMGWGGDSVGEGNLSQFDFQDPHSERKNFLSPGIFCHTNAVACVYLPNHHRIHT